MDSTLTLSGMQRVPSPPSAPENHDHPSPSPREATGADREIGRRVKQYRKEAGVTQLDLARHLKITSAQLHRYEKGQTRISATRLVQIAGFLKVRLEHLTSNATSPAQLGRFYAYEAEEAALLAAYRALPDPAQRAAVLTVVRSMTLPRNDGRDG